MIIYGSIGVLFAIGVGLNRVRSRLFPMMVLLIGHERQRFANLEKIQWGLVVAFFVSFVASVIVAAIQTMLS